MSYYFDVYFGNYLPFEVDPVPEKIGYCEICGTEIMDNDYYYYVEGYDGLMFCEYSEAKEFAVDMLGEEYSEEEIEDNFIIKREV